MSRSGYSDEMGSEWDMIRWRGAVNSAIKGKRGQSFLKEMLQSLDSLPEKKLIKEELVCKDGVCALGSVAVSRGMDVSKLDPYDYDTVSANFGISNALAQEIMYINDKPFYHYLEKSTPEKRFEIVRDWVIASIKKEELTLETK